jgi:nucleoside-diphosphate kinase
MVKPDGVQRRLIGKIIQRIEEKGLKIVALKMIRIQRELAERHYAEHREKPFFEGLIDYITSGPVVVMVVEGKNSILVVRQMVGKTNPVEAGSGTIRGDFGLDIGRNIVHASDSLDSAIREIDLFFKQEEILDYSLVDEIWVYE